jgi:hypothetical protein
MQQCHAAIIIGELELGSTSLMFTFLRSDYAYTLLALLHLSV